LIFRSEAFFHAGKVEKDHARLGELLVAVPQNRRFAHFVDIAAKLRRALNARLEKIDKDRLPVGADEIEHFIFGCLSSLWPGRLLPFPVA
jgi:hypothetical protein